MQCQPQPDRVLKQALLLNIKGTEIRAGAFFEELLSGGSSFFGWCLAGRPACHRVPRRRGIPADRARSLQSQGTAEAGLTRSLSPAPAARAALAFLLAVV